MCRVLKSVSLIVLIVLIVNLCGCGQKDVQNNVSNLATKTETSNISNFDLLYCSKDGFDPYTCKTKQNFELSYLLFDPLIKLDNNYNITNVLASDITLKDKTCTITLKDVNFTDGTKVSSDDVVFSFKKAKASKTIYYYSLKNAVSIYAVNNNTVNITLSKKDPYFVNCLDFPIIKNGSDTLKNSDNKSLPPIGSGRYMFSSENNVLNCNENYFLGTPFVKIITLADSPDLEADYTNIEAGLIDYYYSNLETGEFPKMNGNKATINLNNLVFLGVNTSRGFVNNVLFRQAISSAINRTDICEKSYFTNATPALGPYPSFFAPAKDFLTISPSANSTSALNNLSSLGYTKTNSDGLLLSGNKPITIYLLVNSANPVRCSAADQIAEQLLKIGIKVVVEKESNASYYSRIKSNNYDLYLGEMRISNNMDLSELINVASPSNNKSSSGSSSNSSSNKSSSLATSSNNNNSNYIGVTTKTALSKFYLGEYTINDVITVFTSELPVIPVVFRTGISMYTNNIKSEFNPSFSDLFFGFESLK